MSIIHSPRPGKAACRHAARARYAAGFIALALLLAGCASVPYQEMSDARQAVESAQATVADMPGPSAKVERAEHLLRRAEHHLNDRQYREAREMAEQAKALAIEARESAAERSEDP